MSLVDDRTAAYWPLLEQEESVRPSDASGQVADLAVPAGVDAPTLADETPTGFGRVFNGAAGFYAKDVAGAANLTRGATIAAVVALDLAAVVDGQVCTLIQRGRGGAADPICLGLRVVVEDAAARLCTLRLYWQTVAGADVVDNGVQFTWPASGEFLLLAATREVIRGQLAVRYQVHGERFDGEQDHALDCGGNDTADLGLGTSPSGTNAAPTSQDGWAGTIDALQVLSEAVAPEELEWTWLRMTQWQPEAVETVRRLVPQGVYSQDPDSRIQRELANEGRVLGYVKAIAARLRYYIFPSVCWGSVLERWERILELPPKPGDDIQTRRNRVQAATSAILGFAVTDLQIQLAEFFDQLAADVQIIEFDNDYSQDFAALPADALQIDGNAGTPWGVAAGVLSVDGIPSTDLRFLGSRNQRAPLFLWPLAGGYDAWVNGAISAAGYSGGTSLQAIALGRRDALDEWVFVGVQTVAASPVNFTLVWCSYKAGVLSAPVVIQAGIADAPLYLRLHYLTDGTVDVRWGASDAAAKAAAPTNIAPGIAEPTWAGFGVIGVDEPHTGKGAFQEFSMHTPTGRQRLHWYGYRDPGLAGAPDMPGARNLIASIKPANTEASAVQALRILCDDTAACDREPIGA